MITTQPQNTDYLVPGDTAVFTVVASGEQLSYQWQANETNITDIAGRYDGTTTGTLIVSNITDNDDDSTFMCVVTNSAGSDTSDDAQIIFCECVCVCSL